MQAIDIARRMAELGQPEEALRAYTLAVRNGGLSPEEVLEAAVYILRTGGNYEVSYACFLELYQQGQYREETLALLTGAFYEPNVKELRNRYERNVKLLKKYPYLFRKDFPSFEDLPIQFYPYSDDSYIPFFPDKREFGEFIDIKHPVISRNFFRDLEKPILAAEVYSQYELEYLRDNVRRSDYVGRENHVYLHYQDWGTFCAYLQCWNMRSLLEEEKLVFLIGDEISQYPIDFKARFGIDYSQYPVKPVGIREVTRMIWLSQLQSHNGISFFSEIFYDCPNLLFAPLRMLTSLEEGVAQWRENTKEVRSTAQISDSRGETVQRVQRELFLLKDKTDKDILVAGHMGDERCTRNMDPASRIAPAFLFSPHFGLIRYHLRVDTRSNSTILYSPEYEKIRSSEFFRHFKYIKTVAPLRRPTTSSGAAVRYMWKKAQDSWDRPEGTKRGLVEDDVISRVLNRSYMIDPQDRLVQDSVLVRFEDGKLNPKATFMALAEFLDLPYEESMAYCSSLREPDRKSDLESAKVFDLRAVNETYPDYLGESERYFEEYFLRDIYKACGYDFQSYDGKPMDEARVEELVGHFTTIDFYIMESMKRAIDITEGVEKDIAVEFLEDYKKRIHENRQKTGKALLRGLHFVNNQGQPLHMMPLLKLDPALLEQPLYH